MLILANLHITHTVMVCVPESNVLQTFFKTVSILHTHHTYVFLYGSMSRVCLFLFVFTSRRDKINP